MTKSCYEIAIYHQFDMEIYLQSCKDEEGDPNVAMDWVSDRFGLATEFEASSPTSNSNGVGRDLARDVQVKPCWISRGKNLQVSGKYDPRREHNPPAHHIQHSMNLNPF